MSMGFVFGGPPVADADDGSEVKLGVTLAVAVSGSAQSAALALGKSELELGVAG